MLPRASTPYTLGYLPLQFLHNGILICPWRSSNNPMYVFENDRTTLVTKVASALKGLR